MPHRDGAAAKGSALILENEELKFSLKRGDRMYREQTVAVVIPAHNEALLLPVTLDGLPDYVDYVIVVDDASADRTAQIARDHQRRGVSVLSHAANRGVGGAIVTGYRHALSLQAALVVVVGADAQMDPREMSRLLDPLIDGHADYAKGDRLGHPQLSALMPRVRLFGNRVLTMLTRWSSGYEHVRDSQCGYTAITRETLESIPLKDLYPRYGFPNDVLAKLAELDCRVIDCPVTPIYGMETSGIRINKVVGPILWLLLRSGLRRFIRQRAHRRAQNRCAPDSRPVSIDTDTRSARTVS